MAVGKQGSQVAGKKFNAKLTLKEGTAFLDNPYWGFSAKQTDGSYAPFTQEQLLEAFGVEGPIYDIAGDLISVDTRVGEYQGDPIHNVTLGLQDAERGEIYYAQFIANNNLGRSIANSLVNLKAFSNVQLGLWGQFSKATNKTYPACSIRQGDSRDTVKWKFDPKEDANLNPREFAGKGGKVEKDYTKVDEFMLAQINQLGDALREARGIAPAQQETPQSEPAPKQEQPKAENPKSKTTRAQKSAKKADPVPAAQDNDTDEPPF